MKLHCSQLIAFVSLLFPSFILSQTVDDTISFRISLLSIQDSLTVNQPFVPSSGREYEWTVLMDTDDNPATGDARGYDVSISLSHYKSGSAKKIMLPDAMQANTWILSKAGGTIGHLAAVTVDLTQNLVTLKGSLGWAEFANVSKVKRWRAESAYLSSSGLAKDTVLMDSGAGFATDPVGDVPYPFIDIKEASMFLPLTFVMEGTYSDYERKFELEQNYPNPFNPSTLICYQLPKAGHVTLNIYNTLGQLISTLVDKSEEAGYYSVQWNAIVPGGIYFYRLKAGEFVETKKMMLLR
jgi:hypothetical protein